MKWNVRLCGERKGEIVFADYFSTWHKMQSRVQSMRVASKNRSHFCHCSAGSKRWISAFWYQSYLQDLLSKNNLCLGSEKASLDKYLLLSCWNALQLRTVKTIIMQTLQCGVWNVDYLTLPINIRHHSNRKCFSLSSCNKKATDVMILGLLELPSWCKAKNP